MNDYSIYFPNLGIYLDYVPKSFNIFGIEIALYGIIIAFGMMLGLFYAVREAKRTGQNEENYWDLATMLLIFSVIGARLYYVVFYWDMFKDDWLSILNIRNGGLAIYGGVLAGIITVFMFSRKKKLSFWKMADTLTPGLLIGQIIGRFGNFTNREVFGGYTDGLFAMQLPLTMVRKRDISVDIAEHILEGTNYIQVHPTFLYESAWNLALFVFLLFYKKKKKFDGEIFYIYLAGYGIGRAWIEGIRTDQLLIPVLGLPVSQVLAVILTVIGIIMIIWNRRKEKVS
ncbi:MAG: prolipoprotein diacylglyceryl transferase [Lachnospiraceae bacterium]|nr:prolipoprotein diacylglyceryl transferase [Lachnospiraceae bacterium]